MFIFPNISWQNINYIFFIIPMFLIVIGVIFILKKKYIHNLLLLSASKWTALLVPSFSNKKLFIKTVLYILGFLFLFIAFLRPQWDEKKENVEQQGRDVFIALDISRSMLAEDVKPNRLEAAKKKILKLIKNLSCERVGLILFSSNAMIQCPLTSDYGAFYLFLDNVDAETISSGTTALDQAIKKALFAFSQTPSRKNKILVLFTDGEDFSTDLSSVKQKALKEKMLLFTVGVGTKEGAPIPIVDNNGNKKGHQKDENGNVVISKLNDLMLKALSVESGAVYSEILSDDNDIIGIIDQVKKLEKEKFQDKNIVRKQERYNFFTFASFICFLIEWII